MVGTVGAARKLGGRIALARTGAAHLAGLLAGAVAVFGLLGVAGELLRPGRVWLAAAAAACVAAAAVDGRGLRVRPQIRLQVPERWRRSMPLARAVFLYGVLLGTGFASAVPAAAAWALVLAALALGSLPASLALGVAVAVGRALPVLALAPSSERPLTERPGTLRLVRLLAACTLVAAAAAALAGAASAAGRVAGPAFDPSAADADLAWTVPRLGGFLQRAGETATRLPGTNPAIGGALIAWHQLSEVTVATRATLEPLFSEPIVGVRQLAVSDEWLVLRVVAADGLTKLIAQSIANTNVHRVIAAARPPDVLGRPSISGSTVVYPLVARGQSSIMAVQATGGRPRVLRGSRTSQLLGPSLIGATLLYVETSRCTQQLRLGGLVGTTGRALLARSAIGGADPGHQHGYPTQGEHTPCGTRFRPGATVLWTTALAPHRAYVTELRPGRGGTTAPTLVRVGR
jgi:hypothetical protein